MKHKQTATIEEKLNNCLEWIIEFMLVNSKPPSTKQIADGQNISIGTARAYIKEMNGRKMIDVNISDSCLGIAIPGVYYVDDR